LFFYPQLQGVAMPKAQTVTYEDVFTNVLKTYQQVADKAIALNPDKAHVLKMMKSHARQLVRTGGPEGVSLFDDCPPGWLRCPNGDCVPIGLDC
jgi:hypothetical protein